MHSEHTAYRSIGAMSTRAAASVADAGTVPTMDGWVADVGREACIDALQEARGRTLALIDSLPREALLGPRLSIVNPPLWELGHLGWFQERWLLRPRSDGTLGPSRMPGADALYDSSVVAHATRWDLPLPTLDETRAYLSGVLAQSLERIDRTWPDAPTGESGRSIAFHATVCAQHEQMHAEALAYSRQTLGHAAPPCEVPGAGSGDGRIPEPPVHGADVSPVADADAWIEGGTFQLGARPADGFVFDNEKWAHPVRVEPFSIARTPTTCAAFAAFVDDGGYRAPRWWTQAGWAWRLAADADRPAYWRRMQGRQGWEVRRNDGWQALRADEPMLHVNAHEAEAWCRWAGRRLPTEAEWERAASVGAGPQDDKRRHPWGDAAPDPRRANLWFPGSPAVLAGVHAHEPGDSAHGCRQMTGNVWEWTASAFQAYPGFVPDPYRDYSQPWFGSHRVLRGGCFATAASLIRNTWRNFFTPDRRDVYAGFRSCAPVVR